MAAETIWITVESQVLLPFHWTHHRMSVGVCDHVPITSVVWGAVCIENSPVGGVWGGVGLGRTLTFTNGETRSPAATVPDKHTMSEPVISPGVTDGSAHLLPVSYYSVVRLLRDVWLTLLSLLLIRCLMDGWTENVAASVKGVQQLKVIGLRVILSDRSQILCLGTQALMLWIHHL